jgi:hypothetical protein
MYGGGAMLTDNHKFGFNVFVEIRPRNGYQ